MWRLSLFGPVRLEYAGRRERIPRRKAKALLAYLSTNPGTHSRETLVALLWPEHDRRTGRADLSRMLSSLRGVLGTERFVTDRDSVKLDKGDDLWVDVLRFQELIRGVRDGAQEGTEADRTRNLVAAASLYQNGFLAGFTLPNCPGFDEWQTMQYQALERDLHWALAEVVARQRALGDLPGALEHAHQWVAKDPLSEEAQRWLIRLYAETGQRGEALRHFESFEGLLREELGVEPQAETRRLIRDVQSGSGAELPAVVDRPSTRPPAGPPNFDRVASRNEPSQPFVARSGELKQLESHLAQALSGRGQVAFVLGGAGRGKTSLMDEFVHRSQAAHPDLLVARGSGSSLAGAGDPYHPFQEVMGHLTGDVNAPRAGSPLTVGGARRLWAALPQTIQALIESGPQLIDVLIPGEQLLARARAAGPSGAGWLEGLQFEISRLQRESGTLRQSALFGQFTKVLHSLSQVYPILITLDDLQWIDEASIALLFHFGRRLSGSRILMVGAYRSEEVMPVRDGEASHLVQVVEELRRVYGNVFIDLAGGEPSDGRQFIDALLDLEPNSLSQEFRETLFRRTLGHPLFTVELLRELKNREDLVLDDRGQWFVSRELDWTLIPSRVEAVIARRLDRLDATARSILAAASVQGEIFTPDVVAQVTDTKVRQLLRILSHDLFKKHRLVNELSSAESSTPTILAYRFRHALFQEYIYQQLSSAERRQYHRDVAAALETTHRMDPDQVVVQIAHHYGAAEEWARACRYIIRAGDLAYEKSSLSEAVRHYRSALDHWPAGDTIEKADTLRKLGECQWVMGQQKEAAATLSECFEMYVALKSSQGASRAQRLLGRIYWELGEDSMAEQSLRQALAIAEREPDSQELPWAMAGMSSFLMHLGQYEQSIELGEQALSLARILDLKPLIVQCLCDLGSALSGMGDWSGLDLERESLEMALQLNRAHDAGRAALYYAEGLIYRGDYDRARETIERAIQHANRMQVSYIAAAGSRMLIEIDWCLGLWTAALDRLGTMINGRGVEQVTGLSEVYLVLTLGQVHNDLGNSEAARAALEGVLVEGPDALNPRVALLGELLRAQAAMGDTRAAGRSVAEILNITQKSRYLFPNIAITLLSICRLAALGNLEAAREAADHALEGLVRLDNQFRTVATAAHRKEGQGWVSLMQGDALAASDAFEYSVREWERLRHPYDLARALSGLARARGKAGDRVRSREASDRAQGLVEKLAGKIRDPGLKQSLLESALASELHQGPGK